MKEIESNQHLLSSASESAAADGLQDTLSHAEGVNGEPSNDEPDNDGSAEEPAGVAICSPSAVVTLSPDEPAEHSVDTPSAADHVATATPDGALTVSIPIDGDDRYIPAERVDTLVEEAYLRGRNEAVRMQILADTSIAVPDSAGPQPARDFAELFMTRPSVWDQTVQ